MVVRQNYFDTANFRLPLKDSFIAKAIYWQDIPALMPLNNGSRFMLIELNSSFPSLNEAVLHDFDSRKYYIWRVKETGGTLEEIKDTLSDLLKAYRPVIHSSEDALRKAVDYRPSSILMDGASYVINDVKVSENRLLTNAYHVLTLQLKED
ncbi:hypothetical protein [Pseudobacter ginsenosidimutans]|nr:hypothetical protein [Pseudobacter ginsenosidimutans]QEC44946.1 hypothetical protein FSB84_25895 [Pseudobacter ginsenosidimutans]